MKKKRDIFRELAEGFTALKEKRKGKATVRMRRARRVRPRKAKA